MSFTEYLVGIPIAFVLGGLILLRPHWGIILLLASLPIQALYPNVPGLTSALALLGLITLGAFLLHAKEMGTGGSRKVRGQYLFGFLFMVWITVTNPQAAIFSSDRNWLWTYVQLFILMWLASHLLPAERHRLLMKVFVGFACVSAVAAIAEGHIGNSFSNTIRAEGLTGNANEEALYLVVAIVFWFYLYMNVTVRASAAKRIPYLAIISLLVAGVFETVSRTGFVALVIGVVLVIILGSRFAGRRAIATRLVVLSVLVAVAFSIPSGYWNILSSTQQAFIGNLQGTDPSGTFYLRLTYWTAAIRMWRDAPVVGQGIGQFRFLYGDYRDASHGYRVAPAHNAFVSLLAETGLVGLALYVLWLVSVFRSLWRVALGPSPQASIATTWAIVFLVLCIFMLTGNFEYGKLVWILAGISMVFVRLDTSTEPSQAGKEAVGVRYLRTSGL